MKTKTLWKLHSWLGLLTGLPLLVIAFSGSVLVFKDELNALLIPGVVQSEPLPSGRLSMDALRSSLEQKLPDHEVVGWAIYDSPERSDFIYVIEHGTSEWLHVHLNPYTGAILGEPAKTTSELMGWLLELHYTFLADHTGMLVTGILAILLCALGVTGILIYRRFWKNFFTFRWKTSARLLAGNLHKRIGVISSPVFLILGITGAWWNLQHVFQELGEHHEEPVIERGYLGSEISLDELTAKSREAIAGFYTTYIDFPRAESSPITFYGSIEGQNSLRSPYNSTVSFGADTGKLLSATPVGDLSLWRQVYDSFTPLHFGTFGGIITRILWCILGAAPGLLAISGFIVWIRRSRSLKAPQRKRELLAAAR